MVCWVAALIFFYFLNNPWIREVCYLHYILQFYILSGNFLKRDIGLVIVKDRYSHWHICERKDYIYAQ